MTKPNTKDWRNLPYDKWNTSTIHAFLIDETRRKYDAEYKPGGGGPLSQRWRTEQGMVKRELTKRGAKVVRKFIEICWREYYSSDPKKYPYPTFGFMLGFMDRHWTEAERDSDKDDVVERAKKVDIENIDEGWF